MITSSGGFWSAKPPTFLHHVPQSSPTLSSGAQCLPCFCSLFLGPFCRAEVCSLLFVCERGARVRVVTGVWRSENKHGRWHPSVFEVRVFCISRLCTIFQANWPLSLWECCLCLASPHRSSGSLHRRCQLLQGSLRGGIRTQVLTLAWERFTH